MTRPLEGLRVVELAGIGPGPFAAMLLTDMGADVIRVERPGLSPLLDGAGADPTLRGRTFVEADLKVDSGVARVRELVQDAEALIEGYRPGVMERLGLGPDVLLADNPALVYGRMTGYGQDGPLASVAGHDINYISIAGVLGAMRRPGERPMVPLNLIGDYGGGGMFLAVGLLAAVMNARRTGEGCVVDVAMCDGASMLATLFHGLRAGGTWTEPPGTNVLDGGAHFYDVYETSDSRFMAVGAIESQFYGELLRGLEIAPEDAPQWDRDRWPELKRVVAERFRTKTRAEWSAVFEDRNACVTPVLELHEAAAHPHNSTRGAFIDGLPAPVPRFVR